MSLDSDHRKSNHDSETTLQLECDISEPVLAWAAYEQLCLYAKQHGLEPEGVKVTVTIEASGKTTPETIKSLTEQLKRLGSGRLAYEPVTFHPDLPILQQRNGL